MPTNGEDIRENLERKIRELEVLTEMSRGAISNLGIDQILDLVYDQTSRIIDLSNAQVQIAFYDKTKDEVSFPLAIEQDKGKEIDRVRWGEREEKFRREGEDDIVEQFKRRVRRVPPGLNEYVIRTKQPLLIVEDFEQKAKELGIKVWPEFGRLDRPTQSWLGVPMIVARQVIGVISVQSLVQEHAFDQGHLELLATVANQAAVAIENARLYRHIDQDLKRRIKELEVLTEMSRGAISNLGIDQILDLVYNQTSKIIDLSNAQVQIAFYDQAKDEVRFPLAMEQDGGEVIDIVRWSEREAKYIREGEDEVVKLFLPRARREPPGLNEYVIRTKKSLLIVQDFAQKAEEQGIKVWPTFGRLDRPTYSWLGVPMIVADRVIGVISVQSLVQEHAFDRGHLELLATVANQAAVAIENARLYADQSDRIRQLEEAQETIRQLERARVEVERARVEAEKWAYLGKVAGSLAHRIGNKGGMIRLCVQDLEEHLRKLMPLDEEIEDQLNTIRRSNQYLLSLSNFLFKPRKAVEESLSKADILLYLEDALEYAEIPADIRVERHYAHDLPPVLSNKYMVEVFMELIVNAAEVMHSSPEKKLIISTHVEKDWMEIRFTDSGPGIGPEDKDLIFELFAQASDKRLSEEGHKGFGLWWVRTFLREIQGDVWHEPSPSGGTTFFVRLPVAEAHHEK